MDDVSDNEDDIPYVAPVDARPRTGIQCIWTSIGNLEQYIACQNERCYLKKLINGACPSCGQFLRTMKQSVDGQPH